MNTRPVIITQPVCLKYQPTEISGLVNAANHFPPYEIQEFARYIRIDCYSLIGRGWRCAFIISKSFSTTDNWVLDAIEYLPALTFNYALSSLGQLESHGLSRLKYGL